METFAVIGVIVVATSLIRKLIGPSVTDLTTHQEIVADTEDVLRASPSWDGNTYFPYTPPVKRIF